MTADEVLFAIVSSDASVGALIGAGAACRLYPGGMIPQDEQMPAASYEIVVGVPENVMDGSPRADHDRIQVNAFTIDDHDLAKAIGAAIERALESEDAMRAYSCGIRCVANNGIDYDADEVKRFRDSRDYSFWTSR